MEIAWSIQTVTGADRRPRAFALAALAVVAAATLPGPVVAAGPSAAGTGSSSAGTAPSTAGTGSSKAGAGPSVPGAAPATACPPLLRLTMPRLQDDAPQDLCQYAGRVVLVVNTASRCGYTRQYDGLERLYERYRARGFVVLGFPSNDFGGQEPGSNRQIAEFCENTFGVKFPMFAKSAVAGSGANPLFAGLARQSGVAPAWNFHKYLLSRDGRVAGSFPGSVEPEDRRLVAGIEGLL